MRTILASWLCVLALCLAGGPFSPVAAEGAERAETPQPPSILFGELYRRAALSGVFPDGKALADAIPLESPTVIIRDFKTADPDSDEALAAFMRKHFQWHPAEGGGAPPRGLSLSAHIRTLWPILTRKADNPPPYSSLLPLPEPYIVPGGRFTEVYYWDSYFTLLGFGPAQAELKRHIVNNFAYLIRTYGHIPNGNRTYYLSRSQPPFFFKMAGLLSPDDPAEAYAAYLPELKAEYAYWMKGAETVKAGEATRNVVRLEDGAILNRYWDERAAPRDESYREDVATARKTNRDAERVYRDIRAAAESGWDFSSRWFADGESLSTIETTDIIPPDLNSILYGLERAISEGCARVADKACKKAFKAKAKARARAIRAYLWNQKTGLFDDYQWRERKLLDHVSAASLYPLFFGVARKSEAKRVAAAVARDLLKSGGLVTTNKQTGQQWDAPNGWAPLQWIAVAGLCRYHDKALAETIAERWLTTVSSVYDETGKLLEKYNVVTATPGGGGEYPTQDGFGWTNGVTAAFLRLFPDGFARRSGDGEPGANARAFICASSAAELGP